MTLHEDGVSAAVADNRRSKIAGDGGKVPLAGEVFTIDVDGLLAMLVREVAGGKASPGLRGAAITSPTRDRAPQPGARTH